MTVKKKLPSGFKHFDVADTLDTPKEIAGFISICIEEANGDQELIMHALNTAARAQKQNMTQLAKKTGITRSGLYEALSGKRNPSFITVIKLLDAMGMTLTVTANK